MRNSQQIIGILHGTYEVSNLSSIVNLTSFHEQGYTNIFQTDGATVLIFSGDQTSAHHSGLFDFYHSVQFHQGFSYDQFAQDMKENKSGTMTYTAEGQTYYPYYAPMGINDWYVITVIPNNIIYETIKTLAEPGVLLSFELFFILFIMAWIIISFEKCRGKKLLKLTGN